MHAKSLAVESAAVVVLWTSPTTTRFPPDGTRLEPISARARIPP